MIDRYGNGILIAAGQKTLTGAGFQSTPDVAALAGGQFVTVWSDIADPDGGLRGRVSSYDETFGPEFTVNTVTAGPQYDPSVAGLTSGGFVATWTERNEAQGDSDLTGIRGQIFTANGAKLGGEFIVNTVQMSGQNESVVTGISGDRFVVAWTDFSGTGGDASSTSIKMQLFAANGARIGGDRLVNSVTLGDQSGTSLAALSGGGFVATWSSSIGDLSTFDDIKGRIFDSAGNAVGAEFLINTSTRGPQFSPEVAALPGGGFVVTWLTPAPGGPTGATISAQPFAADGSRIGGEITVVTSTGNIEAPMVTAFDGGFLVAWTDYGAGTVSSDLGEVRAQLFDLIGARVGSEFVANRITNNSQAMVSLATLTDQSVAVVFRDASSGEADIAERLLFRPAEGTNGADSLAGTATRDIFDGLGGDDSFLLQQGGRDVALGGTGDDIFLLGSAFTPAIRIDGEGGTDRVVLDGNYSGLLLFEADTISNVETLELRSSTFQIETNDANLASGAVITIDASALAPSNTLTFNGAAETNGGFRILGGAESDTITSGRGADLLNGGAGGDQLIGGAGNDTYIVDSTNDLVIEFAGGGSDAVFVTRNYTLAADAEVEVLSTIANAAIIDAVLTGNRFSQTIVGDYGNNRLAGGGASSGTGDVLIGLRGDDIYLADSVATTVIEAAGEGFDTVIVSAAAGAGSFTLTAGAEVELLQAEAGTAAINITGNALAQRIEGNAGNNILNGGGGSDTLVGFGGNDQYLVRELGSVVLEANGGGSDTVFTTVSYNLGVNEVEVLSTVDNAATTPIDLIGNFATQTVIGNYGNNVLNGGSGGADVLIGLRGDDLYAAGNQSIKVIENAGEGNDTLVVFGDYQLRSGTSVEVLSAQDRSGTEAYTLRGNEVAQTVAGNAGNNVIDGRGGSDVLIGGAGADTFAFTAALGAGNVDSLVDFLRGTDRIGLASDIFAGVAGGVTAGSFVIGNAALDGDDRVLYDQATGRLFYDADANGTGVAVQFAQLTAGTLLSAADFTIVAPVGDLPA